jgi:pimeloyl-ACP methyl ester carboxylesterase
MATAFVLVHGAWHSSWCWNPVIEALADRGARGVAVDLPAEDPDAGLEEYAAAVVQVIDDLGGDDVVLVGHSMGGITLPAVTQHRPVAALVYVTALTTEPGRAMDELADASTFGAQWEDFAATQVTHESGGSSWPREPAIEAFYHDCVPRLADAAVDHLRVQHWRAFQQPSTLTELPAAPATYVVCTEDRVLSPAWQRDVAARRVGATVVELSSGHSPMLSKPRELVELLLRASGS